MSNFRLVCNSNNCRRILDTKAYITSCSHIFCLEHSQDIKRQGGALSCPACKSFLHNEYDFMLINLNPSEQYKAMVLNGLNPEQLIDILNHAIGFYNYQLNYERNNKDNIIQSYKEKIEELTEYCKSLMVKYQTDIQKHQRNLTNLKHQLEERMQELEQQQQKVAEYKRTIYKLTNQIEMYKRERNMEQRPATCKNGMWNSPAYFF